MEDLLESVNLMMILVITRVIWVEISDTMIVMKPLMVQCKMITKKEVSQRKLLSKIRSSVNLR